MQATRPKSFKSSILLGLAIFLHRKFEPRNLLRLLSSVGLCATYEEAATFEHSPIFSPIQDVLPNAFCQFVFDNADFNANTLYGLNTIHNMGGVQSVTLSTLLKLQPPVKKLKNKPTKSELTTLAKIPVRFSNPGSGGFDTIIIIDNLEEIYPCKKIMENILSVDALFIESHYFDIPTVLCQN